MTDIKIKVTDGMNVEKRRHVYKALKDVLTQVNIPIGCFEETTQMWRVQEELRRLEQVTGIKETNE